MEHHHTAAELAPHLESKARDEWQKPTQVITMLGALHGKTVMDLGAGTGYFSFKLANAGAKVIAADVDTDFIAMLEQKKAELRIPDQRLITKLLPYDSPELEPNQLDMVFTVDTYHHISQRVDYFSQVHQGLSATGQLIVIDYKKDHKVKGGPSMAMRVGRETVVAELKQAGFTKINVNTELLPKQYFIQASK